MPPRTSPQGLICWDLDGVVLTSAYSENSSPNSQKLYNALHDSPLWQQCLTGQVTLPHAVSQKSAELGISLADQNDLLREWQGVFLFRNGTIRQIRRMKERGWQTAIASNQDGRRAQTLRQILFLDDVVDVWGFSAEMGLAKPNPAFYKAIHAMAKAPHNLPCVMIDDKPDNLEAPAAMGWQTHLYQTEAGLETFLATLP